MKKVGKVLLDVLSCIVLCAIVLPLTVALLFSLPRVQSAAGVAAARLASRYAATEVTLGRLGISRLSEIELTDLTIYDFSGDTAIFVNRATAKLDRNALLRNGELIIGNIVAEHALVDIYKPLDGKDNVGAIFDLINLKRGEREPKPFVLTNMKISDSEFRYRSAERKTVENGIEYTDMLFTRLNAESDNLLIDGKRLEIELHNVSGHEKSGAVIDNMSTSLLVVDEGLVEFTDAVISTDGASLTLPTIKLSAPDWETYKAFNDSVEMYVAVRNSKLNVGTLNRYVDGIATYDIPVEHLTAEYSGLVKDFSLLLTADIADASSIALRADLNDVTNLSKARFDVSSLNVHSSSTEVKALYRTITGRTMPAEIVNYLDVCGSLWINGSADGMVDDCELDVTLATDIGRVDLDGSARIPRKGDFDFAGTIAGSDVRLGRLTGNDDLGKATFVANGNVALSGGEVEGKAKLDVSRLQYRGYDYTALHADAKAEDQIARLTLSSSDPNLLFTFEGNCNLNDDSQQYDLLLDLQQADFEKLGLSSRRSWLTCNLEASGNGFRFDEMELRAIFNNIVYLSERDTLSTDIINITAGHSGGRKSISLYSSLADVEYRSTDSYDQVIRYFTNDFAEQFPIAADAEPIAASDTDLPLSSSLTLNLKSKDLVENFVGGLTVAAESSLFFAFNPSGGGYSFSLDSGFVEWDDFLVSNVSLTSDNLMGRPSARLDIDELFAMGTKIPDITFEAAANGNEVDASLIFGDSEAPLSGRFAFEALFARDTAGKVTAEGSIRDSHISDRVSLWNIAAEGLNYSDGIITVGSFEADCGDQSIFVGGEISSRPFMPLEIRIDNLDLHAPSLMAFGEKFNATGRLNGYARLTSLLGVPDGSAEVNVSGVTIDNIGLEELQLSAQIGSADRLDFSVRNMASNEVLINGNYNFSTAFYEAGMRIDKMDVSLLDPLLSNMLADSKGTASIDLRVEGKGNSPQIFGTVAVDGLQTHVVPLGVDYRVEPLLLSFNRDVGTLRRAEITDSKGAHATLEGGFNLADLNNIAYDIRVVPSNFSVLATDSRSSADFYGDLAVSGALNLHGSSTGTTLDGVIRTERGSVLSLALGGSADFASADYIKFVDREALRQTIDTTDVIELKRLQFNRKNNNERRRKNFEVSAMVQVGTDTEVRLVIDPATDNVLTTHGTADLNITLNADKRDFQIRGDYRISDGTYNFNFENIISKEFTINSGSYIRWNGNLMDADIDISAVYKLKTSLAPLLGTTDGARSMSPVDCIINMKNRLSAIDLSFAISVPTANAEYQSILSSYFSSQEMMATQFVYLLALGTFYSESNTATQGTAFGAAAGSAIGFSFLTAQVSRLLSSDSYKFNLKYNSMSDYSSSGYGVDFQTELINDRLLLELEANLDTGDNPSTTDMNPLSGGGSLTLLLDRAGNLIMKGFSRTIDRFDENQGLQESGVGVYYGRSFNRFGDLFRKNRDKPTDNSRNKQKKR